jgi:ketosteroid isomerase-like protein
MSENLDLVRSIYADWERGNFGRTDWVHHEVVWAWVGGPEPTSGTGIAEIGAPMRNWLAAWDEWYLEATEYRELDSERVLVSYRGVGRGKTSGLEAGQLVTDMANVFDVRHGKVVRFVVYWDRSRAFADLGLEE